jgi:hypothetical protein
VRTTTKPRTTGLEGPEVVNVIVTVARVKVSAADAIAIPTGRAVAVPTATRPGRVHLESKTHTVTKAAAALEAAGRGIAAQGADKRKVAGKHKGATVRNKARNSAPRDSAAGATVAATPAITREAGLQKLQAMGKITP